jgi:hypothetical protein
VARGRWSIVERTLVGGRTSLVVFIDCPVARPNAALRRVMGLLLHESGRRESEALWSGPLGIRAICPASEAAEPRGAREAECRCRLPRGSKRQQIVLLANTVESMPEKNGIALSACAGSEVALVGASDCKAVKLLSTQIVRKTGESTFHLQRRHTLRATLSFNAFQQYEWLARLATAKLERRRPIFGLAHPPPSETTGIH